MNRSAIHGGEVFAAARDLGLGWDEILDFSANLNPLGPPHGLKKHLFDRFGLVRHYPDPFALGWREELARRHGLDPNQVLAGNGTTALIYLLTRTLRPRRPVVAAPAFGEYDRALAQIGVRPKTVRSGLRQEFDLTAREVDRIFDFGPDLVFMANPSSPAGRLLDPEILEMVLYRAKSCGAVVILDEAFLDFTSARTMAKEAGSLNSLVVLRSLTKFYALPGLRLGYLTATSGLARRLLAGFEPWSVNVLAQWAGLFCLDQEDYAARTRTFVSRERAWLADGLARSGLGRVIPSSANYLLVKVEAPGLTVDRLVSDLKDRGILVRDCASFQGLKGYIRVAVNNRKANRRLLAAVRGELSA